MMELTSLVVHTEPRGRSSDISMIPAPLIPVTSALTSHSRLAPSVPSSTSRPRIRNRRSPSTTGSATPWTGVVRHVSFHRIVAVERRPRGERDVAHAWPEDPAWYGQHETAGALARSLVAASHHGVRASSDLVMSLVLTGWISRGAPARSDPTLVERCPEFPLSNRQSTLDVAHGDVQTIDFPDWAARLHATRNGCPSIR